MQTKNKPTNSNKKALIILWSVFIIPIISLSLFFVLITYGVLGFMPTFEELENPQTNLATEIISSDGKILGTFFKENRIECQYNELSEYIIDALISTEDERFYKHSGIDFIGLSRVMFKTVLLGDKNAGGGSTISQQLAKMLFPREKFDNPVDIVTRKFREWVIAVKLEKSYTKEEILSMYLNKFDFLHNADGIKMASEVYFNKLPKNLKIEEAAMLVGMLKNPALFNPKRRPDTTFVRRNVVLYQMYKNDKINKQEFDSLKQLPLGLNFQNIDHNFGSAPYFREWLRMTITASKPNKNNYWSREIYKRDSAQWVDNPLYGWCNKNEKSPDTFYNIYKDGLKIY
nr:biosynthetic peptidoglycan transglycosylase [Bacteroidales bacterium]